VSIPAANVHAIQQGLSPEETAAAYEAQLRTVFEDEAQPPRFDAVLLGCGPDGHTASLFPEHPLLQERSKWVASLSDSPKPPPSRITLTLPVLKAARVVAFIAAGEGKAPVVRSIFTAAGGLALRLVETPKYVCGRVAPAAGQLVWYVDADAAQTCPSEVVELATPLQGSLW
jgi:6-phosphogluconolactonase